MNDEHNFQPGSDHQDNFQPGSHHGNGGSSKKDNGFFDGNPKMLFVFGIVTGIAVMALFGGSVDLPSLQANSGEDKVVKTFDAPADSGSGSAGVLAPVTEADHIRGDINKAKVVLVEYSDFECPFCERHHPNMLKVMEEYGDDVAWVYRHFPLSFHPEANPSAIASECAADQGKFWEFADAMFDSQDDLGEDLYQSTAKKIGLNMKKYNDCYENGDKLQDVNDDLASGSAAGVSGTPATFINGQLVSGAVPFATLKDAIDSLLEG